MKKILRNIKYRVYLISAYFCLHIFRRDLLSEEIWLISEKRTEARDNGYHLFKYLTTQMNDIVPVYVIDKTRPDYKKVKELGVVIQYDSFEHFVYFLAARYRIGGQVQGGKPFIDVGCQDTLKFLRNKKQVHFFIKHGIAKDDIPTAYDYRLAGYDVMFCGAQKEYDYYKERYNYPENRIKCPGLCRFDNLISEHTTDKIVLVMPTYRKWLMSSDSSQKPAKNEIETFRNSDYFIRYSQLLLNPKLNIELKNAGYNMLFYPHYTMQPFLDLFRELKIDESIVTIASREKYDVQDLLMRSKVLLTDYSSVFFDFGYMEKPIIFYQFDFDMYRENHYSKGWFDYKTDALGPVFEKEDEVINYLIDYCIQADKMESVYLTRTEKLFEKVDSNNCRRAYEIIKTY